MMNVAVGCDPNADDLKREVIEELRELGCTVTDYGDSDPIYPNVAIRVAEAVAAGAHDRGILVCGTGIGVSIAANKVPGAYAALVENAYAAERAAKSNNANIITFGAQTVGYKLARSIVRTWMQSTYDPLGRSEPKVQRIYEYEREHMICHDSPLETRHNDSLHKLPLRDKKDDHDGYD